MPCVAILKSGVRAGDVCGAPNWALGMGERLWCGRHRHMARRLGPLGPQQCVYVVANDHFCENNKIEGHEVCQQHHDRLVQQRALRDERGFAEATLAARLANPDETWDQALEVMYGAEVEERLRPTTRMRMVDRYLFARVPDMWHLGRARVVAVFRHWLIRGRIGPRPNTILPEVDEDPAVRQARIVRDMQAAAFPFPAQDVVPPPPVRRHQPRLHGLGRLATDPQNVHTAPVSTQTNLLTQKLFEKGGDDNKRYARPEKFLSHWLDKGFLDLRKLTPLSADIDRFYSMRMVRDKDDYLYRRVFNAVAKVISDIDDRERRKELSQRFYEECSESVGMCAEGHLTRLCNVFVGFDDEFQPEVSVTELLQQKIGAISVMEVSVEEKLRFAVEVFSELKVSEADQAPWREALEAM